MNAGGQYTQGGPHYNYEQGPDGRRYATSGHVNIDLSEGKTPEETVKKMQTVRRAALAPAEPSGPDRQVAAEASRRETEARLEVRELEREEAKLAEEGAEAQAGLQEAVKVARGEREPLPGADSSSASEIQSAGVARSDSIRDAEQEESIKEAARREPRPTERSRPSASGGSRRLAAYEPGYPGS